MKEYGMVTQIMSSDGDGIVEAIPEAFHNIGEELKEKVINEYNISFDEIEDIVLVSSKFYPGERTMSYVGETAYKSDMFVLDLGIKIKTNRSDG